MKYWSFSGEVGSEGLSDTWELPNSRLIGKAAMVGPEIPGATEGTEKADEHI